MLFRLHVEVGASCCGKKNQQNKAYNQYQFFAAVRAFFGAIVGSIGLAMYGALLGIGMLAMPGGLRQMRVHATILLRFASGA